jgi:hypothetical protein
VKIYINPIVLHSKSFNSARYKAEIDAVKKRVTDGVLDDFQRTTATWQHKFRFGVTRRGNDWYVSTKDEIYGYVDQGTRPHVIRARSGKRLAFRQGGFRSKTQVDVIGSGSGRAADGNLVRPESVNHPGTKPRNFSKRIKEKWQKIWITEMQAAIRRAAKG